MKKKNILLVICLMVVVSVASIAGTIAWLTDKTETVTNTFINSDVDIGLTEDNPANNTAKMVPGTDIEKDPVVTVQADSEACWVFVKIEKSANYGTYLEDYEVAEGWTELTDGSGIYYREVADDGEAQEFAVLKGDKVTVKTSVTKAQMDALEATDATYPTLSFTAYAIQKEGFTTAAVAWAEVSK